MVRIGFLLLLCTSCGVVLQKTGTKSYRDPITKTEEYRSLNRFQQDFLYVSTICGKHFPLADKYFPKEERRAMEREILGKLAGQGVSDLQFQLSLKQYLSRFENQHTHATFKGITINGIYPFIPYNHDSSWYIMNVPKTGDTSLIGKRIIQFNGVPIREYEKELFRFYSGENLTAKRKAIEGWWYRPLFHEHLKGKKPDSVVLTLETGADVTIPKVTSGELRWQLSQGSFKSHPITKSRNRIYDYQMIDSLGLAYLQFQSCYDKIELREGIRSYVRPWLRPAANFYVNVQTRKKKPSQRLRRYFDPERPYFAQYISQMVKEANERGIDKLVLDLRNNNGGSILICMQLLYHLTDREDLRDFDLYLQNSDFQRHYFKAELKEGVRYYENRFGRKPEMDTLFYAGHANSGDNLFSRIRDPRSAYYIPPDRPVFRGKVVVIADYSTNSAAALFTALLQDNDIATVIGTEVSNNPTGPTVWTPFRLPNSKGDVSISSSYLIRPDPSRPEQLHPDIRIEKSLDDLLHGGDPLFDKALEVLGQVVK